MSRGVKFGLPNAQTGQLGEPLALDEDVIGIRIFSYSTLRPTRRGYLDEAETSDVPGESCARTFKRSSGRAGGRTWPRRTKPSEASPLDNGASVVEAKSRPGDVNSLPPSKPAQRGERFTRNATTRLQIASGAVRLPSWSASCPTQNASKLWQPPRSGAAPNLGSTATPIRHGLADRSRATREPAPAWRQRVAGESTRSRQ